MKKEKAPLGLYIHIPFCRQKCAYCDFYSLPSREDKMDAYTDALIRHIREVAPRTESHRVDTVYFGGGTPSYLGAERLRGILRAVMKGCPVTRDAEITLEANPDSACDIKALRTLRRAGFNRLSLGVQSADDGLLRAIGRIHTFAQVQQSVTAARKAGFRNISMDLIYGLPGQTMQQWEDTLSAVIALAPEHISCYGLKLEPGTPLYERRLEETFPDDDAQADMYLYAVTALEQNGYGQYEISNFAKPGYESRHNLKYWRMQEYAGFHLALFFTGIQHFPATFIIGIVIKIPHNYNFRIRIDPVKGIYNMPGNSSCVFPQRRRLISPTGRPVIYNDMKSLSG